MHMLQMTETSQQFFDMTPTDMLHAYMHAIHADEVALRVATQDMDKAHRTAAYWDTNINFLKAMLLNACGVDENTPDREKHEVEKNLWTLAAEIRGYTRRTEPGKIQDTYFIEMNIERIANTFEKRFVK